MSINNIKSVRGKTLVTRMDYVLSVVSITENGYIGWNQNMNNCINYFSADYSFILYMLSIVLVK